MAAERFLGSYLKLLVFLFTVVFIIQDNIITFKKQDPSVPQTVSNITRGARACLPLESSTEWQVLISCQALSGAQSAIHRQRDKQLKLAEKFVGMWGYIVQSSS